MNASGSVRCLLATGLSWIYRSCIISNFCWNSPPSAHCQGSEWWKWKGRALSDGDLSGLSATSNNLRYECKAETLGEKSVGSVPIFAPMISQISAVPHFFVWLHLSGPTGISREVQDLSNLVTSLCLSHLRFAQLMCLPWFCLHNESAQINLVIHDESIPIRSGVERVQTSQRNDGVVQPNSTRSRMNSLLQKRNVTPYWRYHHLKHSISTETYKKTLSVVLPSKSPP